MRYNLLVVLIVLDIVVTFVAFKDNIIAGLGLQYKNIGLVNSNNVGSLQKEPPEDTLRLL